MDKVLLFLLSASCLLTAVSSLSCYTCNHQGWNWGACTESFQQCGQFQDACASYTSYHLPLSYNPRGERYHSISKGCDTQQGCQRRKDALDQSTCSRTSYADWSCVECCVGDLCNYYITLNARSVQGSVIVLLIAMAVQYLF